MTTAIFLFGLGLALVVAEIFIPSFGLLGMAAALCIVGGVVTAYMEDPTAGHVLLGLTVVLVPLALTLGLKWFPRTPLGRRMTARGYTFEDGDGVDRRDEGLEGARGVVEAALRPAGIARIEGRRVDVVSRGEPIEAGAEVVVVDVSGNRVVVARA